MSWEPILTNEHSPKENETSFALKNVVFDDAEIFNNYATNLNVCFLR